MNKEDLKKFREEQYEKDTNEMIQAINENHHKAYERHLLQEQVNKIKKEKEMKKIRRLDIATIIIMILMAILIIVMVVSGVKDYNDLANACDESRGYICSDYEIRQYAIRGE